MVKLIFLIAIILCCSTGVWTKTVIDLIIGNEHKKIIFLKLAGILPNPCTKELPPALTYKIPGRRINVAKCLEFIGDRNMVEKCRDYARLLGVTFIRPVILGGRRAEEGEFLHMGALGWKSKNGSYKFKCGGSIISPNFMITAAHCTYAVGDSDLTSHEPEIVRIGSNDIQTYETSEILYEDIKISKIVKHPQYKSPKQYFDVALLELDSNVSFNEKIQPACLWDSFHTDRLQNLTATGWGATQAGSTQIVTELRVGDLDLIDKDTCEQLLNPARNRLWTGLEEHQMCAGKLAGGVDTCQGDSGGPLQAQLSLTESMKTKFYYIVGVTSFGFGCGRPNSPGVYTRVASFVDWIEENVWPNEI